MTTNVDFINYSDEELAIELAKNLDQTYFEQLYTRYESRVFNKCLSFVHSKEVAEDLTHDIFLKLYLSIGKFKGLSKFSSWLYSLTYNYCVNYIQRDKNYLINKSAMDSENLENVQSTEGEIQILEMKVEKLKEALELISPENKSILLLKYQDDVSIKELEKVLDLSTSAVKMRLSRAKIQLIKAYNSIR